MTAKVITFGIQKGGVGKSTTSGIIAHLLAQDGNNILVVDMDSQGNVTDLITQLDPEVFEEKTILDAFKEMNAEKYIIRSSENIHVLPSDDFLASFARFLYTQYKGHRSKALNDLLEPLKDKYDYIIIDTPPSLGEHMTNALCASDYVVILAESSKWAFTAIPRFLGAIAYARRHVNPNLKVAGILRTMNDARRSDSKAFVNLIGEEYPNMIFDTIIRRKANIGRIAIEGLFENKELSTAVKEYKKFYEELMNRMEAQNNE